MDYQADNARVQDHAGRKLHALRLNMLAGGEDLPADTAEVARQTVAVTVDPYRTIDHGDAGTETVPAHPVRSDTWMVTAILRDGDAVWLHAEPTQDDAERIAVAVRHAVGI